MSPQDILKKQANEEIAKMLGWEESDITKGSWEKSGNNAIYVVYSEHNNYPHRGLPFDRDYNYLMQAKEFVCNIVGCRFFVHNVEDCIRIAVTDEHISSQTHGYLSGNLILELRGHNEKELLFYVIAHVAKMYNNDEL